MSPRPEPDSRLHVAVRLLTAVGALAGGVMAVVVVILLIKGVLGS